MDEPARPSTRVLRLMTRVLIVLAAACLAATAVEAKWPWARKHVEPMNVTYDHINEELEKNVVSDDANTNMLYAEKMLNRAEGIKGEALKQLVALKSIQKPDSCTRMGSKVVDRNNLACRGQAYIRGDDFKRRIDSLVHHYALHHSLTCDRVYQKNCLDMLKALDEATFKKLLGLSVAYYHNGGDEKMDALIEEIEPKKVGDDFTTKRIIELDSRLQIVFPKSFGYNSAVVYNYLKAAVKAESGRNYLGRMVDEKLGELVPNAATVRNVFNEYVLEPCKKLLNVIESEMDDYDHNVKIIPFKQQSADLSFRFLHAAVDSCKLIEKFPGEQREKVVDRSKKE